MPNVVYLVSDNGLIHFGDMAICRFMNDNLDGAEQACRESIDLYGENVTAIWSTSGNTTITWNAEDKNEELNMASMSDEQLEKMIKELQRRKSEKKGCQVIYPSGLSQDDLLGQLPF